MSLPFSMIDGPAVSCPHGGALLASLPCAPIISYLPKHTVIVKGSRCIAALDVGGKNGNKLRRKRLSLQGILRDGYQCLSFCFPHPVHRNADAALHVENTGVIVSSVRRPPGTATIRQTVSGPAAVSSDRPHTKREKSECFPQIGQAGAKARIYSPSPWITTPPLCSRLFQFPPAREIKFPLSPLPPA